jgi:hypothetical protein
VAEAGQDRDDRPWRPASSGPSFVYVLPCLGEDILKLGMSRDPLDRIQTLHARWFDFFDLDAGLLIQTDRVREARDIELRLGRGLEEHNAPAPLLVRPGAGGHTEWYRGAQSLLEAAALEHLGRGYQVHQPLRPWLRRALEQRGGLLFHWSTRMLEAIEEETRDLPSPRPATPLERTLRNALDAHVALELPFESLVPAAVYCWHQRGS